MTLRPSLAAALLGLSLTASASPDLSVSTVETLPLRGSVHLLRTSAPVSNPSAVASVGPDGVFLVDTGFSASAPAFTRALKSIGSGDVRYITNTHPHGDHTLGNEVFGPKATVIGTAQGRARSMAPGIFGPESPPLATGGLPELIIEAPTILHFNDEEIEIIPMTPGHTDGDIVVHFRGAKVLAVGDYFFLNRWPIIDASYGGSMAGYLDNISALLDRFPDDTIVAPGHPTFAPAALTRTTVADWRRWHGQIKASIAHITAQRAAGASLEAVVAAGVPDALAPLGEQPAFVRTPNWIEQVYLSWPGEEGPGRPQAP